ncbi:hypothetical protein GCM10023339_07230 [Alloalcanivorax gelatiniphagus]
MPAAGLASGFDPVVAGKDHSAIHSSTKEKHDVRKLATLVTAAVAATALVAPGLVITTATADTTVGTTDIAPRAAALKLTTSAKGSHFGQPGVTITAVSKKKKGKVVFSIPAAGITETKKLKKGKAKLQVPATLAPATYKVKAKVKGSGKAKAKFQVYNSTLSLNAPAFTLSIAAPCTQDPVMNGAVVFKGVNPTEGYVDLYLNGNIKGGSSSPDFLTFEPVGAGGTFEFGTCDTLWSDLKARGVGSFTFKALYTPTPAYAEYVYSDFVTVNVVP